MISTIYSMPHSDIETDFKPEITVDEVIQKLKIDPEIKKQLEATIRLNFAGAKRYFSLDFKDLTNLAVLIVRNLYNQPTDALQASYQKMFFDNEVTIAVPTVTGLPFVFTMKVPTIISAHGKITQQKKYHYDVNMQGVFASRTQIKLSIVTPFDHQQITAGHDKNVQVVLPIRAEIMMHSEGDSIEVQLKPEVAPKQRLVHYSTWPYTSIYDILSMQPVSQEKKTQYITRREPTKFESVVGDKSTGIAYKVKFQSQKKHWDTKTLLEQMARQDLTAFLAFPTSIMGMEQSSLDITYEPSTSSTKYVKFTASFARKFVQEEETSSEEHREDVNRAVPSNKRPEESAQRMEEFLKKVTTGIKHVTAGSVDLRLRFERQNDQIEYLSTVAVAISPVDVTSGVLAYFRKHAPQQKDWELAFDGSVRMPFTPISNIREAMPEKFEAKVRSLINYGEKIENGAEIVLQSRMEQTPEYRDFINKQHKPTHGKELARAILKAGILDQQTWTVEWKNVGPVAKNMTYQVYSVLRHLGYPYMSEDVLVHNSERKNAQLRLRVSPDLETVTLNLETPVANVKFQDIRLNPYVANLIAINPMQTPYDRLEKAVPTEHEGKYLNSWLFGLGIRK